MSDSIGSPPHLSMAAAGARQVPGGSVDRALAVLRHMAGAHEASASEIAEVAGTSRSTAYRIADRLTAWGFLQPSEEAGRWVVGPEAVRLGLSVITRSRLARTAPDLIRTLMELTGETSGLAIPLNDTMVFLHRELGPTPSPASTQIGTTRPMHCTAVGKAWLSALTGKRLDEALAGLTLTRHTPATITDLVALRQELEEARHRGWAVDSGELSPAIGSCGAPVLDASGLPVAAVSIWGPLARVRSHRDRLGMLVASTAGAVSRRLQA